MIMSHITVSKCLFIIGKTKRHLATMAREHFSGYSAIFYLYLPAAHVIILPLRIFIFCHMATMILIIMHQHGASFLLNVF